MTPQPQQVLSCDTCNHAEKSDAREYPIKCGISKPIPMYVHKYCVSWFGYVGCASHSSIPAPAALDPADAIPFSDWVSQHDAAIIAQAREDMVKELNDKIDSCISSCPTDARQKPKTMLKRFKQTVVESLRTGAQQ